MKHILAFFFSAILACTGLAQSQTLTVNTSTGLVNVPPTMVPVPNFAALKVGGVTISPVTYGTGVATWLATPSSANLRAALTDETGTGAAVFATSPTFVTPILGSATATLVSSTNIVVGSQFTVGAGGALTSPTDGVLLITNSAFNSGGILEMKNVANLGSVTGGARIGSVGGKFTFLDASGSDVVLSTALAAKEVPITFSTGLTRTVNTVTANAVNLAAGGSGGVTGTLPFANGGNQSYLVKLGSDQTTFSNTTLIDIPGMSVTLPAGTYSLEIGTFMVGDTATPGMKFGWVVDNAVTMSKHDLFGDLNGTMFGSVDSEAFSSFRQASGTTLWIVKETGIVTTTTATVFKLQFAQFSSSTDVTTVKASTTYMVFTRK